MEFKITDTHVYGLDKAIMASGNPMRTTIQTEYHTPEEQNKAMTRASALGRTKPGEGHDQFLTGIIVQFDISAPLYMWKEIQRYHFLDFISSQSTMHRLAKFDIKSQCVSDTDPVILNRFQELLSAYNKDIEEGKFKPEENKAAWRTLVASLPCGFVLSASMSTNYRQLKTIYAQRKNHRLKEWHAFCDWCESLPMFKQMVLGIKEEGEK